MKPVSITGPVERIGDQLGLLIPLVVGGKELAKCTRGIGVINGDYLEIVLLPWLLEMLDAEEGSLIHVDNDGGEFNMRLAGSQTEA